MLLPDQTYEQGSTTAIVFAGIDDIPDGNAARIPEIVAEDEPAWGHRHPLTAIRKILAESSQLEPRLAAGGDAKKADATKPFVSNNPKSHPSPVQPGIVSGKLRSLFQLTFNRQPSHGLRSDDVEHRHRVGTPENFGRTAEFFNNIPDYLGDPVGPFNLAPVADGERPADAGQKQSGGIRRTTENADVLKECEQFLHTHRIRSDFFCRYRKAVFTSQSAPPSWPHKQSPAPVLRTAPHSASPRPFRSGSSRMRRFQKSTAIYTLPARDKRARRIAVTSTATTTTTTTTNTTTTTATTTDASSSNEAVHLQQRLKSLSTELVTLRNRLHVGPASPNGGGGNPTTAPNSPPANGVAPLSTSTPAHCGGVGGGQQSAALNGATLSTSPPNPSPFTAGIPIGGGGGGLHAHKNQKPTYSNQTIAGSAAAGVPIVSPRNTSIPHPLPPHVSSGKATDSFPQFGGTLPRRTDTVSAAAAAVQHQSRHSNGTTQNQHATHNTHTTSGVTHGRNIGGTVGGVHNAGKAIFGSCNNLIEHSSSNGNGFGGGGGHNGIHSHAATLTRARSPCKPLPSHATHTDFGGGDGVTVQLQPQTHWSHQHTAATATAVASPKSPPKDMDDLIHLPGPLTEDAVMRTLQARFADGKHFTNVGPILLSINPYKDVGNPLTLSSTRSLQLAPQLHRIVQEAVRQQAETGYPQAIILSGTSGAGKTHCSMLLLRQLFAVAGGGPETDAFKHLAAAFTVLRSLGSAKTATNSESSRIGQFIEVQVTDGALYRTKIHCYFLDQTRVIRPLPNEKNYHIFYQMLAGLNRDERAKLNLEGYSPANLRYLQSGDIYQDEKEDAARFQAWKACLGILGIPFLDVVRVLAAVLLLGNVQFVDGQGLEVDVRGEPELNAVAGLLGVQPAALFRGLTTRTHNARGQLVKSVCDANISNMTRDSLAKALYCRTVATIVRRANSLKRLGSTLGTLSSDSNESVHNQADAASQHTSTIGGNAGSKSMAALNNAVRHATDGFIGILDMFGFEEPRPAQLEHLCINLCAETMQHFYNTHIFKSSVESCRDEGIMCDTEIDYVDNVPCIDLISSLRTGLLSMLDAECSIRGTAESYVAKIKVQHRNSTRLEPLKQAADQGNNNNSNNGNNDPRIFTIRHFAGRVEYDTSDFLDTNRDVVSDDLVSVFYKHTCNFGFATHLFGSELKALYAFELVPRGLSFRIAPTSHTDLLNGDEPVSTLTQDFHTRLDNLLRTLVHARPHFVRCIRSNGAEFGGRFDRQTVVRQIRALQVLETVNLMASGFPHRMRFKQFSARYRMLAPFRLLRRCEEKALDDCRLILRCAMENPPAADGSVTLSWAPGKRHVFLSEGIRQHLEALRVDIRTKSAIAVQAVWRGWQLRRRIGSVKRGGGGGGRGGNGGGGAGGGGDVLASPAAAAGACALLKAAAASATAAAQVTAASHGNASGKKADRGRSSGGQAHMHMLIGRLSAAARVSATATAAAAATATAAAAGQPPQTAKGTAANGGGGGGATATRPRPQPIAGTPPPDPNEKCDAKIIQQTCTLFGLDLERPPPVPPSRPYTVTGNAKLGYPQSRLMKMNYPEDSAASPPAEQLLKGDTVTVVGASHRRGHLIVENNGVSHHVPFQFMELVTSTPTANANSVAATATSVAAAASSGVVGQQQASVAAVVAAAAATAVATATAAAAAAAAAASSSSANVVNLI